MRYDSQDQRIAEAKARALDAEAAWTTFQGPCDTPTRKQARHTIRSSENLLRQIAEHPNVTAAGKAETAQELARVRWLVGEVRHPSRPRK